jgi:hypothetical protein
MLLQTGILSKLFLLLLIALVSDSALSATRLETEGGVTLVTQTTSDNRVNDEVVASIDYELKYKFSHAILNIYFEANTTPRSNGVSSLLGEVNGDAGSALDRNGKGRVQISEFKYAYRFRANRILTVGLIDPTAYLDSAWVMNDETGQFLGSGFVNNSSIEFPDYTLGFVYEHKLAGRGPVLKLMLTGSHGLGDNPGVKYSELFDVGDNGKGVFTVFEAGWETDKRLFNLGVWYHSGDHDALNGSGTGFSNYGIYAVLARRKGPHSLETRLGLARAKVSEVKSFLALGYEYRVKKWSIGVAYSHSHLSDDNVDPDKDDIQHAEVYVKREVARKTFITASIQSIRNSQFDATDTARDSNMTVFGLRMQYSF